MSAERDEFLTELEEYYAADPQLGEMVFLKNKFDDTTIRGEVTGIERSHAQRGLHPSGTYEIVLYAGLDIKIGGIECWLSMDEWDVTDRLVGIEYKKLPPEVVRQNVQDLDDE